ncbi:MAG: hypothetical protein QXZ13_01510 [Candidatus Diapherotrites archaeon]
MANAIIELQNTFLDPMTQLWNSALSALPGLITAILLVILGYLVGLIFGRFVQQVLEKAKFDHWLEKISKVGHPLGKITIAELVGKLVKWYVFIVFVASAAHFVQLQVVAELLQGFAMWAPHLIVATIIMAIGFFLAELARKEVLSFKAESAKVLSLGAKYFVLIYFALMALRELGLNIFLAEATLLIVIAGIVLTFAIGFGLALKDHAEEIFAEIKKALK